MGKSLGQLLREMESSDPNAIAIAEAAERLYRQNAKHAIGEARANRAALNCGIRRVQGGAK